MYEAFKKKESFAGLNVNLNIKRLFVEAIRGKARIDLFCGGRIRSPALGIVTDTEPGLILEFRRDARQIDAAESCLYRFLAMKLKQLVP